MENEIIVGLDIGTTKVCAVVASTNEAGKINILGVGRSMSDGLTRGVVTNIDKTVRSIESVATPGRSNSTTNCSPSRHASIGMAAGRAVVPRIC